MTREDLIIQLKPILAAYTENKVAIENIKEETDFIKDLKINSANLVDVILDVEEEFGIEIDNRSMEQMLTVGASLNIIETKLQEIDR
jgi:acyl carrier protein